MPDKIFSIEQSDEFYEKYNTLNAKSEEANNSKLYSQAFLNRRCLVLCSGFFEWKLEKKEKIPYYITLKNDELFVFAGIWNKTTDAKGNTLYSYSILTLEANELMANIHNTKKRMPHILTPEAANMWLQPNLSEQQLKELLKPISSEDMKAYTIKKFLPSNIKNINNADIIAYYHYPAMQDLFSNNDLLF
jgi:putative SOS response-associated peptidase YedK